MSSIMSPLRRTRSYVYLLIFSGLMLGGCAAAKPAIVPTAEDVATLHNYQLGDEVKQIDNYELNGWNYLSDRALLLPARPGSYYLLMLDRSCPELRHSEAIGFTSTVGRLRSKFDAVVVRSRPESIERKCYIEAMYLVTKVKKPD